MSQSRPQAISLSFGGVFAAGVTAGVGGSAAKSQSKSRVVSSFEDMLAVCEPALHNMRYYFLTSSYVVTFCS